MSKMLARLGMMLAVFLGGLLIALPSSGRATAAPAPTTYDALGYAYVTASPSATGQSDPVWTHGPPARPSDASQGRLLAVSSFGVAAKAEVTWVDESAAMSPRAADYQAGAFGARSSVLTRAGQAPRLDGVRFDGFDEANGVLIDRKLSVTTFQKSLDQASRQSEALQGSGYTGLWEVPNATQAARAKRIFDQLGITNISVGIVP